VVKAFLDSIKISATNDKIITKPPNINNELIILKGYSASKFNKTLKKINS